MNNINILFFHGKGSTATTSSTAKAVKEHFEGLNVPVFIPEYKPDDLSIENIEEFIEEYIDKHNLLNKELVIIGISRGGYWALKTANKIHNVTCFILNPALNTYNEPTHIIPRKNNRDTLNLYCHLNDDDELFDSKDTYNKLKNVSDIKTYKSGGHRMTNIKDVLNDISYILNGQVPLSF